MLWDAAIKSVFGDRGIAGTVTDIIKEYHISDADKAKIAADIAERELKVATLVAQRDTEQADINKTEASSTSIFVAGWRPFVGWVCGSAFAYTFVVQPFLIFLVVLFRWDMPLDLLPKLDWSMLANVLFGILGLGYMRTQEKVATGQAANGH